MTNSTKETNEYVKNYEPILKWVHVSSLKDDDIVLYMGAERSVDRSHIKEGFIGWTYRGDPLLNNGENGEVSIEKRGLIQKVCYPKFILGEFCGYKD